ncbi:MAG: rhomboid family intramembrane serine protease [Verrucomicrobiota bacterium]
MLDDRSYMRTPTSGYRWSAAISLLLFNLGAFILQEFHRVSLHQSIDQYIAYSPFTLSLGGLRHGYIWQLATFQFMHAGVWHLLLNSVAIYFFGRALEDSLGKKRFFTLYFASGIIGGLLQMAGAYWFPSHLGGSVVGASAGGMGLIAAFATMFPEQRLTLLLFFIIPISMPAKVLLWISAGLAVFGILVPNDNVAHAAHLGGMLAGIAFVRFFVLSQNSLSEWRPFRRTPSVRELVKANSAKRPTWRRAKSAPAPVEDLPPAQFISQEVDPILDKISAQGIHSLTDRERQILDAARKKMARK